MFLNKNMREEVARNICASITPIRYSGIFKHLFNNKELSYIENYAIIDKDNAFMKIINEIDKKKINKLLNFKNDFIHMNILKSVILDIIDKLMNNDLEIDFAFSIRSPKYSYDINYFIMNIFWSPKSNIFKFTIIKNEKEVSFNFTQGLMECEINIYTPYYNDKNVNIFKFTITENEKEVNTPYNDKNVLLWNDSNNKIITVSYSYDNNKKYNKFITKIHNDEKVSTVDLHTLRDFLYDMEFIYSDNEKEKSKLYKSDFIYKSSVESIYNEVKRAFSNRTEKEKIIHNFDRMVPYGDTKTFKEFLIKNLRNYKFSNVPWNTSIMQIKNYIYCIDLCDDSYGSGIFTCNITVIRNKADFMNEFTKYVHQLMNNMHLYITYYDTYTTFQQFLSMNNYITKFEYTGKILYENFDDEIKEWYMEVMDKNIDDDEE